jgi:hypothetical protein
MTIYIIGSGLFGSIARDLLRNEGYDAITIDANLRYAASTAAGCLIKPSWLSCLGNKYKDGMGTLDKLYGLTKIPLQEYLYFYKGQVYLFLLNFFRAVLLHL